MFIVKIWCGLIGSRIVGPYFYHSSLAIRQIEILVLKKFFADLQLETHSPVCYHPRSPDITSLNDNRQ